MNTLVWIVREPEGTRAVCERPSRSEALRTARRMVARLPVRELYVECHGFEDVEQCNWIKPVVRLRVSDRCVPGVIMPDPNCIGWDP